VESYSDTGLSEETTYYYQVRAFNVAGNSGYSNESNATTYLGAPSDLSASPVSSTRINLSWTDNSEVESGFRIERKLGSGGTYSEIATVAPNVTTYGNTGLEASPTYYYRVNAYGGSGNSEYSNEAHATTYLSAPSDLLATPVSSTRINLSWTDNSEIESGFRIERKLGSGGTYSEIAMVGANVTIYSNTNLEASTTYYYRVNAYSGSDNSQYSNEASAVTSAVSASSGGGGGDLVNSDSGNDVGVQPTGDSGGGGGCFVDSVFGGFHDHW